MLLPLKTSIFQSISYSTVDAVVKQFEGKHAKDENALRNNNGHSIPNKFNANSKYNHRNNFRKEPYGKKTMKSRCDICGKYGHEKNEHLEDGSFPAGVKSVDKPSRDDGK